jgi:hypothetical protein
MTKNNLSPAQIGEMTLPQITCLIRESPPEDRQVESSDIGGIVARIKEQEDLWNSPEKKAW